MAGQKILAPIAILTLFLLGPSTLFGQEAIEIGRMLSSDSEISIKDISRVDQTVTVPDTLRGWDMDWVGGLNGSQAAYQNWSGGGVNTMSVTASTVFNARYRMGRFAYAFATNLKYGQARIEGEGMRKINDRFAINNKFNYSIDEYWSAFGNINFSTQFAEGFDYGTEPPTLISDFFAPAYFTQVAGIQYSPVNFFSAEAGMALKQTIVNNDDLAPRYGLDPGENFRFEPGYATALNFEKEIFSSVRFISSLETFTNLQRHIDRTDVFFTNELIGQINDFMNMSFQFMTIYDDDYSDELQVKQVLSVGVSVSII